MAHGSWATDEYPTGCSNRPSSKAAASEEARRTLRYVEPLSEARTPLAYCFSILLEAVKGRSVACLCEGEEEEKSERHGSCLLRSIEGRPDSRSSNVPSFHCPYLVRIIHECRCETFETEARRGFSQVRLT